MTITLCAYDAPNNIDGPSAWIKRLLPFLRSKGIETRVIFFAANDKDLPTYNYLTGLGYKCKLIYWELFDEDKIQALLEDVKAYPPDIFIPNYFAIGCLASKWVKEAGIPTIMVLHNDDTAHQSLVKEYATQYNNNITAIVGVSKLLSEVAQRNSPLHTCIKTIPCGAPVSQKVVEYPNNGTLKIVYAGRIEEKQKQISLLTKAFCNAAQQVKNIEFIIYGSGSAVPNVLKIINTLGKGLPVKFGGKLDSNEVIEKFLENHVFVLLSDYEGIPISLMEAMGAGLVPICNNIRSGIKELIINGESGILVNNRDEEFVTAIKLLRENPGIFMKMSSNARSLMEQDYSEDVCNNLWVFLLNELAGHAAQKKTIEIPSLIELKKYSRNFKSLHNPRPTSFLIPLYKLKYFIGSVLRKLRK